MKKKISEYMICGRTYLSKQAKIRYLKLKFICGQRTDFQNEVLNNYKTSLYRISKLSFTKLY